MTKRHFIIAIILVCLNGLFAADPDFNQPPNPLTQPTAYLYYYPLHVWKSLNNLCDWNFNKNIVKTGAFLLPLAFLCDNAVRDYVTTHGLFSQEISGIGDFYGHRWGYLSAAAVVGIQSCLSGQSWNKTFSRIELLGSSVIATALVTETLKITARRERPNGNGYKSFPSGHTSSSFTLAAGLDEIYGKKIGIPAYLMAVFVAASRVNDNKHYLSDTVAGALIGVWIGRSFARQHHLEWQIGVGETKFLSVTIPLGF
jgi:membrane-associated phospholipid phosphatase